ncbi:MAG: efflux RND transporter permease subunit, partial [Bacteroidetes bacterium]|nr:efflux RND transporter permease subunit [Bacteroidota bacterium]
MSQIQDSFKSLSFTNWCIRNRTAIYVFTIILSIAGAVSFVRIPKEQFPDIVIPTISVSTIYPGATPVDVENLITKPIERQLKSINGVRKISSKSISDFSSIVVEFNTNVEVAVAKQKVSDAVDKAVKDLPTDLDEDPRVDELDFSEFPIMNINLAGEIPLDKLKNYGEYLEERIESLPQITRVDIVGGLTREIQIYVDLYKMQASGIT